MKKHIEDQQLDEEEQELLDSFERGEWVSSPNFEADKAFAEAAARNFLRKNARINIRLPQGDLIAIKKKAEFEGLPYQTLIASILHKYATGSL